MRIDIPAEKTLLLELKREIAWGDMDALGHVNNTVYFRYMEDARVRWLTSMGNPLDAQGEGAVIANTFCNFYKELVFPGELHICLYAGAPGRSSVDTFATIGRTDDPGVIYAAGGATLVWVDMAQGRSVPLPQAVRTAIEG